MANVTVIDFLKFPVLSGEVYPESIFAINLTRSREGPIRRNLRITRSAERGELARKAMSRMKSKKEKKETIAKIIQ